MNNSAVFQLLAYVIGEEDAKATMAHARVDERILAKPVQGRVDRAVIAQTLNLVLFHELLWRVPTAKRYFHEFKASGEKVHLDHGAVRTVRLDGMGALPSGQSAILRLLRPLGYELRGEYPLLALKMVGRSYAQLDFPEEIPQFFVSEIFPEEFSPKFQAAVAETFSNSRDPLSEDLLKKLEVLEAKGSLSFHDAANVVLKGARCFDRQHDLPREENYGTMLAESAEMAWISTEGNAFNHATVRVDDLGTLHAQLAKAEFPVKPEIEVSANGNVLQTAFVADTVSRRLKSATGSFTEQAVPGSFCEFIQRRTIADRDGISKLDLSFDPKNATAIFKMTASDA